jgi:lysozyme
MPLLNKFRQLIASAVLLGVFTLGFTSPTSAAKIAVHSNCKTWVRVIDVSSNNPHPFDWTKIAKNGISGIYIKNSEGTAYVNPNFAPDAAAAKKVGIPYGGYYFARPGKASGAASATFFVKSGGATGTLPPALDLEVNELSVPATVKWAEQWFATVKSLTGRTPILYTGGYYGWGTAQGLTEMRLWLAAYPLGYANVSHGVCSLPQPHTPSAWISQGWSMWQYTSVASIPGIAGHVDLSAAEPAWWSLVTGSGIKPPTPGQNRYPAPIYAYGSHGPKVVYLQKILHHYGYLTAKQVDGVFGEQTYLAVRKWQYRIGIPVDGKWSSLTDHATNWYLKHARPYPWPRNYPVLRVGSVNAPKIVQLQQLLTKHGFAVKADGIFGSSTAGKLRGFQKKHHIHISGITTYQTWVALWQP